MLWQLCVSEVLDFGFKMKAARQTSTSPNGREGAFNLKPILKPQIIGSVGEV